MLPLVAMLLASSSSPYATALATAKLLDKQMETLHNRMSPAQAQGFAERIRHLPANYSAIEAFNLFVDAAGDPQSRQIVADSLSDTKVPALHSATLASPQRSIDSKPSTLASNKKA